MTVIDRPGTARAPAPARILAYLRLGKARIYHHAYGWLLAVLLLRMAGLVNRHTAVAIGLLLAMVLTSQWSGGAADDLGGFRDGSDARNYAGRPPRTVAKKPLLTGALSQPQAVRFAIVCWIVAIGCTLAAEASLSWRSPLPMLLLIVAQICAVQYSVGLKLSYRRLGLELAIFYMIGCIALMPYWLVAGRVTALALLASALFGMWFLMVVCYGNASDRQGDSEVSRHTLAVMLPPELYRVVLGLLWAGSLALIAVLFTTTRLDPLLGLALVPVAAVHTAQLYYGAGRGDWRKARFLGLISLDLGCLGLALALALAG
jgi:1,4-dihydroxy-2-naphthoate octaprenyltransferase